MTTLLDAIKAGFKSFLLLLIVLILSITYLFCLSPICTSCEQGFSFKNAAAFILILATISNIVPLHWYDNIGNLLKTLGSFFLNEDNSGLIDKCLHSKVAIYSLTILLTALIISATILASNNPKLIDGILGTPDTSCLNN